MSRYPVSFLLVIASAIGGTAVSTIAQTTSPSLNGQQNPAPFPQQLPSSTEVTSPTAQAPAVTAVPVTPGVGTDLSSSVGKSFGAVGRGLPGMPGGASVNSVLGAQDPSSKYMRPQTIPSLLCDPAIDLPC